MKEGRVVVDVLLSVSDVGIDEAVLEVASMAGADVAGAPLCTDERGSSSSSDSESSPSDVPPTVDGLLNGESGLSGPSSSASATGIVLATESWRRTRVGKTLTGDGLRS